MSNIKFVTKVLVTNVQAVNTGTSPTTIVNGDVILFDRGFSEVGAAETASGDAANSVLYVGLGLPSGGMETSAPIQTRNIKEVRVKSYAAPAPMVVTIGNINAANNTEFVVRVIYRSEHNVTPGRNPQKSYTFTTDGSGTAAEVAIGLAAKINADKSSQVTAAENAGTLVVTAKPIPANAIDGFQWVNFDVATPQGFASSVTKTVTTGSRGSGHGAVIKDLEQANKYEQRIQWPIPAETTKAQLAGKYNTVTITHFDKHIGDFQGQYSAPELTIVAFSTVDGTPSAKQAAFVAKLESVVESVGVFVQ